MSEIRERRRHPMVIPLGDHVERVLGNLNLYPGTFTNRPNVERLLGLNFLIGADIPNMNTPDPYYKFPGGGRPIHLPIHVW